MRSWSLQNLPRAEIWGFKLGNFWISSTDESVGLYPSFLGSIFHVE
jgi:hypothetical protein